MSLFNEKVLAFVPRHNVEGKKDATGAFQPEARALIKLAAPGSEIVMFDNLKGLPTRRAEVMSAMRARVGLGFTSVTFFCHGWLDGIQAGFQRRHTSELAKEIRALCPSQNVIVPLFCCSTGDDPQDDPLTAAGTGDDSFADKLRDALCALNAVNCRVMGHTTVAHTTMNPMVLFMDGMGSAVGGAGGYPPVSPKSSLWAPWKKALRTTDLRFRMSYMSVAEIHAELLKT